MMVCGKFLYDLGSRNTTMVLQEAGDGTFVAKWTKIFDHPDENQSNSSIEEYWLKKEKYQVIVKIFVT